MNINFPNSILKRNYGNQKFGIEHDCVWFLFLYNVERTLHETALDVIFQSLCNLYTTGT